MTWLREMQLWHIKSDAITHSVTISACEKGQRWITAMTLPREMQHWQMQSDEITYNVAISACEKGQRWITAMTLLRDTQVWHNEVRRDDIQCRHQCM